MSSERRVLVYGASGYTGKLISESLGKRNIPFYAAGRSAARLEEELKVVEERLGHMPDVEVVELANTVESLSSAFEKVDVVINVVGPFMQLGHPVVEACLATNTHYVDTTGEQDWTKYLRDEFGKAFAAKGLLLAPATSFMWTAGAIAAEYVLEEEGIDTIDLLYQIDNGLPSEASTKSFLRMVCHDISQSYLDQFELKPWTNDVLHSVSMPHRNKVLLAHPWGGGAEPIWFMDDDRVRNCSVLCSLGDELLLGVKQAIDAYNAVAPDLSQAEREEWTNNMGYQMDSGEPDKDHPDVQRSVIVCRGQGRQKTKTFVYNVSAAYQWTGEVTADTTERLLNGELKRPGFASVAQAFGHRELMQTFFELGFTSEVPAE